PSADHRVGWDRRIYDPEARRHGRQAEQAARDVDGVGGHLRRPAPVDVERVPRRVDSPHDDAIRRDGFRAGRRPAVSFTTQSNWFGYVLPPQIAFAARTTTSSLRRWSSIEMRFPRTDVEKPHCGLSARRSRGTTRLASRRRLSRPSTVSTRADFVVTRPRTTVLSSGTSRSASNEPERSSSYSRRRRSARMSRKIARAIGSYAP